MNTLDVMRENFLADIIEHPDDDVPRLIFADWLDDNGDPDRAEFIRVQCEMARLRAGPAGPVPADSPWLMNDRRYQALERRERELLVGDSPNNWISWGQPVTSTILGFTQSFREVIDFRRGFVHTVRCPCAAWLEHGPAVVRCQPVQRVELSNRKSAWGDRLPHPSGWLRRLEFPSGQRQPDELPDILFDRLEEGPRGRFLNANWFDCEDEATAINALSAACLRYAREQPSP